MVPTEKRSIRAKKNGHPKEERKKVVFWESNALQEGEKVVITVGLTRTMRIRGQGNSVEGGESIVKEKNLY